MSDLPARDKAWGQERINDLMRAAERGHLSPWAQDIEYCYQVTSAWLRDDLKSRDEMNERRAFWMLAHHRDRSDITPIEKMELALDAAWEVADE